MTPATLADYAKDAVVNAYSYDYVNYREALNATAAKWFTDDGRKAFLRSLDESGNLERVLKGRLILRAMATKVPQLEEEGRRGLQRYWVVQVPVAIEFYSGGDQQPRTRQDFLAGVTIVQTPRRPRTSRALPLIRSRWPRMSLGSDRPCSKENIDRICAARRDRIFCLRG
ncbi:DotI/IcmL family type IV secretion protein [Aeromonas veronii]|uniref:DotI/IcmL family type IV secretion protein n=1 Tax=Aeromonas veronii TaxID=654 RepID=UPI001F0A35B0|nr:DotI/IcmL family type IV secretion protein [Aeromonas veronii]